MVGKLTQSTLTGILMDYNKTNYGTSVMLLKMGVPDYPFMIFYYSSHWQMSIINLVEINHSGVLGRECFTSLSGSAAGFASVQVFFFI